MLKILNVMKTTCFKDIKDKHINFTEDLFYFIYENA